jgi:hypothetical protein
MSEVESKIAYAAGRGARYLQREFLTNPYPRLTQPWHEWRRGWLEEDADQWVGELKHLA